MEVEEIYQRVLSVANYFVKNASYLTINNLKEFDPTVDQIAKDLRTLANIMKVLAGDNYSDENMAINAFQCCFIMEKIAGCVEKDDEVQLRQLVQDLEMHVQVP